MNPLAIYKKKEPWNKGKLVGQKLALKQKQIWAIRISTETDRIHILINTLTAPPS